MVLRLYFVLSPVSLLVTVISRIDTRKTWRQPRGARTTRLRRPRNLPFVFRRYRVHRIPPHVRGDAYAPLIEAGQREVAII